MILLDTNNMYLLIRFISALLIAFFFYCLGVIHCTEFKNKEAVEAGVARLIVDANGKVNLEYNKN